MCTARATLAYGLTVRAAGLMFAAEAWTRLEPTFRFFNLVFLRRRKGGLVTGDDLKRERAVSRVPNEVWEEIRFHLAREETEISQDTLLGFVPCDNPECDARPPVSRRYTWAEIRSDFMAGNCSVCDENLETWVDENIAYWDPARIALVTRVAKAFGLAVPFTQPLVIDVDYSDCKTALTLLAAPSKCEKASCETPVILADCGAGQVPDGSTIVNIELDGLPLDIDRRFKRFIELFNLEVVDSAIDTIYVPSSNRKEAKREKADGDSEASSMSLAPQGLRNNVTTEIKPKWRLCVSSEFNW